jgi:hypothetical protein
MSPQRAQTVEDMIVAGLARGAQKLYVRAVRRPAAHCHRSADLVSEEAVRSYLFDLRRRRMARRTCQTNHYGHRCFYRQTLGRASALVGVKSIASPRQKDH